MHWNLSTVSESVSLKFFQVDLEISYCSKKRKSSGFSFKDFSLADFWPTNVSANIHYYPGGMFPVTFLKFPPPFFLFIDLISA